MRLFAVLTLFLASASISPSVVRTPADPPRTIDIIATDDMKYSVNIITAKPGEQLRVRVQAKGKIPKVAMAHNFVLLKLGTDVLKLLKDGAPNRETDFIPPAMMSRSNSPARTRFTMSASVRAVSCKGRILRGCSNVPVFHASRWSILGFSLPDEGIPLDASISSAIRRRGQWTRGSRSMSRPGR